MGIILRRYTSLVLAIMLSILSTGVTVATADEGVVEGYPLVEILPQNPSGVSDLEEESSALFALVPILDEPANVDFATCFTSVELLQPNGSELPDVVAKDAEVRASLEYKIPTDGLAINHPYGFSLPEAITSLYNGGSFNVTRDGIPVGTVSIGNGVDCTIDFTDSVAVVGDTEGSFYFQSRFDATKLPNGKSGIVFFAGSGKEQTISLRFALSQITGAAAVTNEAAIDTASNSVAWVASVTPTLANADAVVTVGSGSVSELTSFVITTDIDAKLTMPVDGGGVPQVTVVNSRPDSNTPVGASFVLDSTGRKLTCTLDDADWQAGDVYQIAYDTSYDLRAFAESDGPVSFENTTSASVSYPQYSAESSSSSVALSSSKATATGAAAATASVTAGFLSKDQQSYDGKTHIITWVVVGNSSAVQLASPIAMTDNLPAGLSLVDVTINGTLASVGNTANTYSYTGTGYSGGTLTFNGLAGTIANTITYRTAIDPLIWKNDSSKTFNNTIGYSGSYGGKEYGFSRTKSTELHFGGASGGLIGASGKYNATNHTFTWNISINEYEMLIANGVVTVTIPDGQTYKSCNTTVGSSSMDGKVITVLLSPSGSSDKGTIKLITAVDDVSDWATNLPKSRDYSMTAALASASDGINLAATPVANATSEVIKKTFVGYDYSTKEITWKVQFDQNRMAMTSPVITDKLPAGLTYVSNSVNAADGAVLKSNGAVYDQASNTLTLSFDNIAENIATVPSVTFRTTVADSLLKWADENSTSQTISNTASIRFDELGGVASPSSTSATQVGARPLTKSSTGDSPSNRTISWRVGINPNQIELSAPTLVDTLADGLVLDLDSVKLHEAAVDHSLGELTVPQGSSPVTNYIVKLEGQKFSLTFAQAISKAYLLTFDTDNTNPLSASYSNSIAFADSSNSKGSVSNVSQSAASGGQTANPNRGTITLTAYLEDGTTPLAGVTYTIKGTRGFVFTATTDSNGVATFASLQNDTYTLTDVIVGYTRVTPTSPFTVAASSKHLTAVLSYKVHSSGGNTDGGGNGGGGSGNNDSSSSVATPPAVTPPLWSNKPAIKLDDIAKPTLPQGQGGMIFSAVTNSGISVSGVVFEIEVNGTWVTTTTGSDGLIIFPNVPPGSYTVRVGSVPAGYTFDHSQTYTAKVTANAWVMADIMLLPLHRNPNTGDSSNLALVMVIAGLSLTLAVWVISSRRTIE